MITVGLEAVYDQPLHIFAGDIILPARPGVEALGGRQGRWN